MPYTTTAHKIDELRGRQLQPIGYVQGRVHIPDWSRTIDGHTITPRKIQRTLQRCNDAGADMWYIARQLNIGIGAIAVYMDKPRSIPETVAERFYKLFSSDTPLPKAPLRQGEIIDWSKPDPRESPTGLKPEREPDFDGKALGAAIAQKRRAAQMTSAAMARHVGCSAAYLSIIESGGVNYKSARCIVLFRLCNKLGIDIQQFEYKHRVDFAKFRKLAREAMRRLGFSSKDLADETGMSETWVSHQIVKPSTPAPYVSYLEDYMCKVMNALELDISEILLTKKEVGNVEIKNF